MRQALSTCLPVSRRVFWDHQSSSIGDLVVELAAS
jgi:hypothetical protein